MAKKLPAPIKAVTKAITTAPAAPGVGDRLDAGKAEPQRVTLSEAADMPVTSEAELAVIRARIAAAEKRLIAESGIVFERWGPEAPEDTFANGYPSPPKESGEPVDGSDEAPLMFSVGPTSDESDPELTVISIDRGLHAIGARTVLYSRQTERTIDSVTLERFAEQVATIRAELRSFESRISAALFSETMELLAAAVELVGPGVNPDTKQLAIKVGEKIRGKARRFRLEASESLADGAAVPDVEKKPGIAKASKAEAGVPEGLRHRKDDHAEPPKADKADKADTESVPKEKTPRSSKVKNAIAVVNAHRAKVAEGKAKELGIRAILAKRYGWKASDCRVHNLERQLRRYPHLLTVDNADT